MTTKRTWVFLGVALAILWMGPAAHAFHQGGVAECGGCHSMHSPISADGLLVGVDASSTCLSCHEHAGDTGPTSYHISTAPSDMPSGTAPLHLTPGGDFGWVKKTYTYTIRGTAITELGETHGHNIIASGFNYVADSTNTVAPGGTFPGNSLSCISCHDPHSKSRRLLGNTIVASLTTVNPPIKASGSYNGASNQPTAGTAVGVYRLLGGVAYQPQGMTAPYPGSPVAIAPSSYNRTEATTMTRVAYGSGTSNGNVTWGQWCASCHPTMHSSGNNVHPIDAPLRSGAGLELDNYAKYRGSGVAYGTNADSYWSLIPYAEGNEDYEVTLKNHATNTGSYTVGPTTGDQVMCLSCHRAHATGFQYGLRWNHETELDLVNSLYPGLDSADPEARDPKWNHGRTQAEMKYAYYNWPENRFGSYQRVLCNKCHNKEN